MPVIGQGATVPPQRTRTRPARPSIGQRLTRGSSQTEPGNSSGSSRYTSFISGRDATEVHMGGHYRSTYDTACTSTTSIVDEGYPQEIHTARLKDDGSAVNRRLGSSRHWRSFIPRVKSKRNSSSSSDIAGIRNLSQIEKLVEVSQTKGR